MEWMTASAFSRWEVYVEGFRISPRCHDTFVDHDGAVGEDDTEDHLGSPERLCRVQLGNCAVVCHGAATHDIEVTAHPR